jgi:hypothetical protein
MDELQVSQVEDTRARRGAKAPTSTVPSTPSAPPTETPPRGES